MNKSQKVLLIVRDGWGYSSDIEHNMIAQAHTPYTDYLEKTYPTTLLHASGGEVGLPDGFFGNSEVGHMTLGAGRVIEQSLLRIDSAITDGSFFKNEAFLKAIEKVKRHRSKLHLVGLLQKEGVHASFHHLIALLELAKKEGLKKDAVCIHIITDGRDAPKQRALNYITELESEIERIGIGAIVSVAGRYYAMDRNRNWDRTQSYYNTLMGKGDSCKDIQNWIENFYKNEDSSDEFISPRIDSGFTGIQQHDSIIFYNFRKDRARQLTHVFVDENFSEFLVLHKNIHFVAMTDYYQGIEHKAFPDIALSNTLGEILAKKHKTQLRISETEKYAHVTFFFDGGVECNFEAEKKIIIPSPDVKTFDLQPEMASGEITENLISEIKNNGQDFILCNFPNADMVGHTGNLEAVKKGIEAVDQCLEQIIPIALKNHYTIILTADHGNAEHKHGVYETSHTSNLVPCTIVSNKPRDLLEGLGLKNIASTVLEILNIKPDSLYEKSIFKK